MTTIAVVKKAGVAAIAADTLTKWGSAKETATYIANSEKILKVGANYVAVTGNATFKMILRDYFQENADQIRLDNAADIFKTWNRLHAVLKERYFLLPEEDKEDALESSRMDVLIANPNGIFGVSGHRTVQEFSKFYAYGSGSDYALGALWASYDRPNLSAVEIARRSIQAAAEFDDGTGLPVQARTVRLKK
ncbi:MAG TPA: MFS transporter [Burkholderiales bacterium]|jgi:ATP-dependent HslUV protease subunit HslV|nr:MFS transporter [Burkholderiales bacterium]